MNRQTRKLLTGIGLLGVTALVASYPVYYVTRGPKVSLTEEPLSGDAIVRGAYVNSGSRDVGKDPKVGTYGRRA